MATTKKAKPAKKSAPAKKAAPAKKTVKKAAKKSPTKLVKKKTTKSAIKKTVKKAAVKSPTKIAKRKPTKKIVKKVNTKPKTKKVDIPDLDINLDKMLESDVFGSSFLFTGTLTSMQRKDAEQKVEDLGGKIVSAVNSKLDYLVAGEKSGSKLTAAKKIKSIKIIDEKTFLSMLSDDNHEDESDDSDGEVDGKYKIKFDIYGYGGEHCVTSLDKKQLKYWKKKFDDDAYEARQELRDHLWDYEDGDEIPDTHFGKWYDQGHIVHAERAFYESSNLVLSVFKDDEEIENIDIPVTDQSINKEFYDEFVPNPKKDKGKAYLHTYSSDRGSYCHGEFELPEGQKFQLSKLSLVVKHLFDHLIVWNVCYDGEYLDDEGCYDSIGKGFEAEIHFI